MTLWVGCARKVPVRADVFQLASRKNCLAARRAAARGCIHAPVLADGRENEKRCEADEVPAVLVQVIELLRQRARLGRRIDRSQVLQGFEPFCDLLDRMTQETDTRYLIVTHNAVTMSRMHRLYGVTMIEKGVSRLVSVDLGGAETLLAAE